MKKSALIHKVLVVTVSELSRALYVKRSQVCVTTGGWTIRAASSPESCVYVGVIVDVAAEVGTLSLAYGVATGERGHVTGVEAFGREHGEEGGEA